MATRRRKPKSGLEVAAEMNFNIHRRMIAQFKAMDQCPQFTAADKLAALCKMAPWFTSRVSPDPGEALEVHATMIWGGDE